jgi:hypothetical protein
MPMDKQLETYLRLVQGRLGEQYLSLTLATFGNRVTPLNNTNYTASARTKHFLNIEAIIQKQLIGHIFFKYQTATASTQDAVRNCR